MEQLKEYEIWIEGYSATGEHSPASFIGRARGKNFDEACENFEYPEDLKNPYYFGGPGQVEYFHRKGDKLNLDKDHDGNLRRGAYRGEAGPGTERAKLKGNYSIWACQLFDNEADARKSFG
jgi:hypothetical protein